MFDVFNFRTKFPILCKDLVANKSLIYIDNASTTHKPESVIQSISEFYSNYNANVDYSMYDLSAHVSTAYNEVRKAIANYCKVDEKEVVFVSGATEGMNLIAWSYGKSFLHPDDEILIGSAEHHSSFLPWVQLSQECNFNIKWIPLILPNYEIDIEKYKSMFTDKTKLVVLQHFGNVLGNINNVKLLSQIAHENSAHIVIDGAATLAHGPVNLDDIDCDFFVTSGHKCFGPNGSGFIFGKYDLLKKMQPYKVGGRMVDKVSFDTVTYKLPPERFEAGSPNIASIIGFGETIKFLSDIDQQSANLYFQDLIKYTYEQLRSVDDLILYGSGESGVFSFNIKNIHAHDVSTILAEKGIAVRAGNHCAQPLMKILGINGTARISLALYNTKSEIDLAVDTLNTCQKFF